MQTTAGSSLYILLIVVFTFFYAFVQVNPEKLSESLQKQGSYIPGVWPGKGTQDYISSLLMRLSTMGALFLGFVSLIPLVASNVWNLSQSIGLGGTSLLIVVQIALDVIKQLNGLMMKREYIGFIHD
jgi:preprotein translocase subunit SecY